MVVALSNGGGATGAWRTHRHFLGQVASDGQGKVGADFGLAMGCFGPWAKSKVEAHLMIYKTH